ncbi:NAD(+) diphosphatase [Roseovarius sp. C7]|uniref:NAD(+) diphosphatase n=1 Tax=Roseovarius sp. C7 TaxID=3398643 RepID=UPI0039F71B63
MKHAEEVTFGGAGLDRLAPLREDDAALAEAMARRGAETILLWRGKPLVRDDSLSDLCRLPLDHPVVAAAEAVGAARYLLGAETAEGPIVFAQDMSDWEPAGQDAILPDVFLDETLQHHPDLPRASGFVELRRMMARLSPVDAELVAMAKALHGWHQSHGFCAACGQPSRMSKGGWQRDCPACNRPHFPRTDPVVIMLITHGNSVLMGRSPGWPERMYSLLAGFVEPGETIEAAVRREVVEETGIEVGAVGYLASQPWPFPASLMIGCRGEALSTAITIDPKEIEDAIWVPREEIMQAMAGDHPRISAARKGAIAHFLLRNWLADRLD